MKVCFFGQTLVKRAARGVVTLDARAVGNGRMAYDTVDEVAVVVGTRVQVIDQRQISGGWCTTKGDLIEVGIVHAGTREAIVRRAGTAVVAGRVRQVERKRAAPPSAAVDQY